jgi:hypothetical protein
MLFIEGNQVAHAVNNHNVSLRARETKPWPALSHLSTARYVILFSAVFIKQSVTFLTFHVLCSAVCNNIKWTFLFEFSFASISNLIYNLSENNSNEKKWGSDKIRKNK